MKRFLINLIIIGIGTASVSLRAMDKKGLSKEEFANIYQLFSDKLLSEEQCQMLTDCVEKQRSIPKKLFENDDDNEAGEEIGLSHSNQTGIKRKKSDDNNENLSPPNQGPQKKKLRADSQKQKKVLADSTNRVPKNVTVSCKLPNERVVYLSPVKNDKEAPVKVIYVMLAVKDGDSERIPHEQRIDINELLKKYKPKKLTEKNLNKVLLEMETKLRILIKDRPTYVGRVIYVGQSENDLTERAKTHVNEFKSQKNIHSSKIQMANVVDASNCDIRLSYVIKNIPKEYLNVFEVLVSTIFQVQIFGGSAQIGTKQAWETYNNYRTSEKRINALQQQGLGEVVETISIDLFRRQYGDVY